MGESSPAKVNLLRLSEEEEEGKKEKPGKTLGRLIFVIKISFVRARERESGSTFAFPQRNGNVQNPFPPPTRVDDFRFVSVFPDQGEIISFTRSAERATSLDRAISDSAKVLTFFCVAGEFEFDFWES